MSLIDSVNSITSAIIGFTNDLTTRFDAGLFGIITWFLAKLIKIAMIAQLKMALFSFSFSWSIAKSMIQDIGILPQINSAISSISPEAAGFMSFLGFNEIFNILVTAIVTKYVLRFLPFMK